MPALLKAAVLERKAHEIFNRALSSSHQFSSQDIEAVLSDALLSFSPLAVLVGAESARAIADGVTNVKQSFVASIAPVGALGMMATVTKGASLPGIKEMLGAGGQDISDAARALGCAAIAGGVIPRMDENGGMVSNGTGYTLDQAACAIVRQRWRTCSRCELDLVNLRRVPATFFGATMTGFLRWEIDSEEKAMETIRYIQDALSTASYPDSSTHDVFYKMNELAGGVGAIELHWPAPAMPLETNPFIVYCFGCFFVACFVCVASLACSRILLWQPPISSGLLVVGQTLLVLGHVAAQCAIKSRRETLEVTISVKNPTQWLMIDKSRFTSAVALRPLIRRPSLFYDFPGNSAVVTLGQYHHFSNKYIATWHALLVLLVLILGFITFYVGGKSSDVKTIAIYIALFILVNVTKGPMVLYANKPHYTRLNNFGHEDIALQQDSRDPNYPRPLPETMDHDNPKSFESSPTDHEKSDLTPTTDTFPKPLRIYSKFFIRDRHATDLFFFSGADEWILAAHVIGKAVNPIQSSDLEHSNRPDDFLQMPLYLWNGTEKFHGLLLLAIDQIMPEHLFWSLGMEIVSSLMGNFGSPTMLCSQDEAATNPSFLAAFVFTCVRMLSSKHVYCGDILLPCKMRGAYSLMCAIEEVKRTTKEPSGTMPELLALLNDAADAAKRSKGATVKAKKMLAHEDMRFSRLSSNKAHAMLSSLKKIDGWVGRLRLVEGLMELPYLQQPEQLLAELEELRGILPQLIDLQLGAPWAQLKGQIAQLSDKIQVIGNLECSVQESLQETTLWEIQREALRDELRELRLVHPFERQEHWFPQEMLRHHVPQQPPVQLEGTVKREVWEVYILIVQLEALLEEVQHELRKQLHQEHQAHQNELHRNTLQHPSVRKERQQRLEQTFNRNKQNIEMLRKYRPDDSDDDDQRLFQLYQLEFRQTYLELELQEVVHVVEGQAMKPA